MPTKKPLAPAAAIVDATWPELNAWLMRVDEATAAAAVRAELAGRRRFRVLMRIYARYSKLRRTREVRAIGGGKFPS